MSKEATAPTLARESDNFTGWEHASAATRLLQRRRQMFEVQEALEAEKEQYVQREQLFKKREQSLEEKDLALQEQLVGFSKFLQEKDGQRVRHEKKATEEIKIRAQKQHEIRELDEKLKVLKQKREMINTEVQKNIQFYNYLRKVVEERPEEYEDVQKVVDRQKTLADMKETLQRNAETFIMDHVEYREKMLTLQQDKQGEMLQSTTEIGMLKEKLESLHTQTVKLADQQQKQHSRAQNRTLTLGQIKMACDNIYERLQKRSTLTMPALAALGSKAQPGRAPEVIDPVMVLGKCGDVLEDLIAIATDNGLHEAATMSFLPPVSDKS
jgi:chromosome segregation ATPase